MDPVDVDLGGIPQWLVALPESKWQGAGTLWVAMLGDGTLESVRTVGRDVEPGPSFRALSRASPVALVGETGDSTDEAPRLLAPTGSESPLSHPVSVAGTLVRVGGSGDLLVGENRLDIDALPDSRVTVDPDSGRAVVLAGATDRYAHGALGDDIEASRVVVVDVASATVEASIDVSPAVVEGIAPILADLTGDGQRDIVVTETDAESGARLVAYDMAGSLVARGPAIGSGFRWRHQLAVAPFAPDGEPELAVTKTPHIGGTVEFYRRRGDRLDIAATRETYSSHALGSRNLDMARAGDFDGDGRLELVVPTQDRRRLCGLHRIDDTPGVTEAWCRRVDGEIATNLAAQAAGALELGVGRADGVLRIWPT
ncbi:hypothetical protein [Haloarchaeobius sp. HME9146]|uniref:hypothetical protein n=1 Tax=Haloarchaeobius sp. HME9146 TaxID=2978732 RepID=UPI0021BEE302|nr:hypothetical protein [Haloarchaeobius sp. HME9146]MCT9095878.1 hypothetical protein [Haloarchaeobius sp. HME9146]